MCDQSSGQEEKEQCTSLPTSSRIKNGIRIRIRNSENKMRLQGSRMVSGVIFQIYRRAPCFPLFRKFKKHLPRRWKGKGERKKEGRERKRFVSPQRRKNICQGWVRSREAKEIIAILQKEMLDNFLKQLFGKCCTRKKKPCVCVYVRGGERGRRRKRGGCHHMSYKGGGSVASPRFPVRK